MNIIIFILFNYIYIYIYNLTIIIINNCKTDHIYEIRSTIERISESRLNLVATKTWIDKCLQLYAVSKCHQG